MVATPRDKHGKPDEKKRQAGQLTVYRDHGRARFELRSGKQLETEVRIGSTRYVNPNQTALMALDLEDFDQSWDPESGTAAAAQAPFTWGDIVRKKIGDIDVVCFDRRARMQASVTFCADPAQSVLLSRGHFDFSAYQQHEHVRFPTGVTIWRQDKSPLEISKIQVSPQHIDESEFSVPEKSIAITECPEKAPVKPLYTPEPEFSEAARSAHKGGNVVLHIIIDSKGNVAAAVPITGSEYGLDAEARDTVRRWTFSPPTCEGKPINTELTVEVAFNFYSR